MSRVWIDDTSYEPSKLGFTLNKGALGQKPWSYLSSNYPDKAIGYSGIAYAACANYDLGDSYSSPQWTFEVVGERATETGGDAQPADVIEDIWTDPIEGLGLPTATLADLSDYRAWCAANDLSISLVADTQQEARQYVQQVLDATMSVAVPSQGVVKIVPIGDEAVGDWKPNTTPVYDIGEDDLLEAPVITRAQPRDANNRVTVEYYDRSKDYATVPVTASDLTHVNQYGAKTNSLTLHCITRADMAAQIAASTLNRDLYIRSTVELHVDQRFCLLEPMDLITLTFGPQNLDKYPLRVTSIEESDDGELTISAEEWPFGVATGTKIKTQPTSGYTTDYNVAPGNANQPVIFEPPVSLAGEPEVWLLSSGGSHWGGAQVWVSLDDATYSQAGTITAAGRHGIMSAALPLASDPDNANTLAVDISVSGGQLVPVTQAVRDLYQSLCFVGTAAGGELVGYMGADLTGVGRYNLTNMRRGCYGSKITAHDAGSQFARLDGSQFRYPYESGMIGKTLYIKLLSYNKYGAALQSLADVSPVAYVVKGAPLGAVAGLVLESPFTGTTFAAKWNAYSGASYYNLELWANNTRKKSLSTADTRFAATIADLVGWGVGRTVELRVYAVAANGQSTDAAVLIATKAQIAAPTVTTQDTVASMIVSLAASTDTAYKASRICISQTKGFNPAAATPVYDGPQTSTSAVNLAKGTWYVRAAQYDQFGADALNWSSEVALAVSAKADGVQKIADVSTVTAAPGSPPPGGDAYWAAYDTKTGKMATWDTTQGKYTFAVAAADITGKISNAQINQPLLDQVALISAPSSTAGSVAAQVAAEATARANAITTEIAARTKADSDEANARATALLNEQLAREAAITTVNTLRQSGDDSLASAIAQVAAGTGDQFDPVKIWYFDADLESWTGNGTPTLTNGMLRAADNATDPYVQSATGLAVSGSAYRFVKARIVRVGAPSWAGELRWKSTTDTGFADTRRASISEPSWDANGTATVSWDDVAWGAITLDQIRLDVGATQTASAYYLIDWVAVGRPTPGAGVAALQAEQQARVTADAAEATERTTLATQMRGAYTGTDVAQLTQGLLYSERTARTTADAAEATARQALEATINNASTGLAAAHSRITAEQSTRAAADAANASDITALDTRLDTAESNISGNASALNALTTRVSNTEGTLTSQGSAITSINATLGRGVSWHLVSQGSTASAGRVGYIESAPGVARRTASRSYGVILFTSTGAIESLTSYDVFGGTGATTMTAALAALNYGRTVVILSSDEPKNNRSTDLQAALIDCGATQAALNAVQYRGAYLLVGKKGIGEGGGVERVSAVGNADNAWVEYELQLMDGVPVALSGAQGVQLATTANATALTTLNATVTQQGNTLTSQGNAITALTSRVGTAESAITTEQTTRANADSALTTSLNALTSRVGTAESAITTEQTTRANADAALSTSVSTLQAKLQTRPNLLVNGGFENGLAGLTGGTAGWTVTTGSWGRVATMSAPSGTNAIMWPAVPVDAGAWYVLTGDSLLQASAGQVYFDLLFLDASGNTVLDGPQRPLFASHDFTADDSNRTAHAIETQAPAGAVSARARFVWAGVTDGTSIGCRQVKLERGRLPATAYTTESALVDANAQIATEATTRANADTALSSSISQVSARLNTGGDIQTAIVQAQSTATATAGKIAASYGITLSANGYISGLKSYNDGTTSQFKVTADQMFVGASNLDRDEGFYSPSWWQNGGATTWPASCTAMDGGSGDGLPVRYLKLTAGNASMLSTKIMADGGGSYRIRLRIYRSADFTGKVFCGASIPGVAWAMPGPVIAADAFGVPYLSNLEGLGSLQTYTGIWTVGTASPYLQAHIKAAITAGYCAVWLEIVRATGTDMIVDGSITANQIAASAISAAKIQAGAVSADKIAVSTLSAISAALGTIVSAAVELVSSGWSYIRTSSKWWADGVDGFITGASSALGYFQEFRASSGNALILEQKANGTGTGWKYYLQVRDSAGVDRIVIDPATGSYRFKGTVYADAGTFAGALQAATGTFSGTLTANAVNAVSRINIAGEQITVPRSVSGMQMVYSPASLADGEEIPCVITASCVLPITLALEQESTTTDPGSSGDGGSGE